MEGGGGGGEGEVGREEGAEGWAGHCGGCLGELRVEDGLLGVDAYFHAVEDVGMVVWGVLKALERLERLEER